MGNMQNNSDDVLKNSNSIFSVIFNGKFVLENRKRYLSISAVSGIPLAFIFYTLSTYVESETLTAHLTILMLGLPTFFLLWFFRTSDTLESINNNSYFNSLSLLAEENLTSKGIAMRQIIYLRNVKKVYVEEIDNILGSGSLNLSKVQLPNVDFRGLKLTGATLVNMNLTKADLRDVTLENTKLEGTNLEDADLRGANLKKTNLENVKLRFLKLKKANLKNAIYNSKTQFPKGFKPRKRGMIKKRLNR